jgi:precorrin-4 methylase
MTIKGRRIVEQADVIIFADSLVNPQICSFSKGGPKYTAAPPCRWRKSSESWKQP